MPVRRRSPRVPQHRRACPRRRLVRGGPLCGRGHPRRPRHLLLSRRARVAFVFPVDDRAQHGRARRPEPVQRRRRLHVGASCARPGGRGTSTTATSPDGLPSTTDMPRLIRRRCIVARSSWTGRRAVSTSSTRSKAAATMSALPSTLAPTSRWNSTGPTRCSSWPTASASGAARLELPAGLRWSLHRGETEPILGWYSPGLGRRIPAFSLLGAGRCGPGEPLATRLTFIEAVQSGQAGVSRQAVSWTPSGVQLGATPEIRAEAR